MKRTLATLVLVGLGSIVGTLEANAQEPRISSDVEVSMASKPLTAAESRAVSLAAGRILKHADSARAALEEDDAAGALKQVEKGLTLASIVEQALPEYEVKTRIVAGELVYEDEDHVRQTWVPIYEELDRVDVLYPLMRNKLDRAIPGEEATPKAAEASSKNRERMSGKQSVPVIAADLEHTTLRLDLPFAKAALSAAKKELSAEHIAQAKDALAAIHAGVLFEFEVDDLPLATAADNLELAESEFGHGQNGKARIALERASRSLKQYEKTAGVDHAKEVQALHQEIDEFSKALAEESMKDLSKEVFIRWRDQVVRWLGH